MPRRRRPVAAADPPPTAAPGTTLLAGQVLGGFGNHPPLTYIQVKLAAEGNQPAGAPIDVEAKDGYFTIQGLQAGRHYQLIARAKDGEHNLAGVAWATPPNPRLVIRLSEGFQTPDTPPLPPPPLWPGVGRRGKCHRAVGWQYGPSRRRDTAAVLADATAARPVLGSGATPVIQPLRRQS